MKQKTLSTLSLKYAESDLTVPLFPWQGHHALSSEASHQPSNHLCFSSCIFLTISCHITNQNSLLMPHHYKGKHRTLQRSTSPLNKLVNIPSLPSFPSMPLAHSSPATLVFWEVPENFNILSLQGHPLILFVPPFPPQTFIHTVHARNSSFIQLSFQISQLLKILFVFST